MRRPITAGLLLLVTVAMAGCKPSTFWSPDGTKIAMDPPGGIFVYDRETKKVSLVSSGGEGFNPVWSPDGKSVLYYQFAIQDDLVVALDLATSTVDTGEQKIIHRVPVPPGALTQQQKQVLDGNAADALGYMKIVFKWMLSADWHPDGDRVVFMGMGDNQESGSILVANSDGTGIKPIPTLGQSPTNPIWSPDGRRLAFYEQESSQLNIGNQQQAKGPGEGNSQLVVVNADGTGRRVIWNERRKEVLFLFVSPQWSSDSKEIGILAATPSNKPPNLANFNLNLYAWVVPVSGAAPRKQWPVTSPFATYGPDLKSIFYLGGKETDTLVYKTWPFTKSKLFGKIKVPETMEGVPNFSMVMPHPTISPDGKEMAMLLSQPGGDPPLLRLLDLDTGKVENIVLP